MEIKKALKTSILGSLKDIKKKGNFKSDNLVKDLG